MSSSWRRCCRFSFRNLTCGDQLADIKSLWPNDATWWHKSGSTLAQAMACCLTAPNHYLNQCWLVISQLLCYYRTANSQEMLKIPIFYTSLKITTTHPGAKEFTRTMGKTILIKHRKIWPLAVNKWRIIFSWLHPHNSVFEWYKVQYTKNKEKKTPVLPLHVTFSECAKPYI